jgi:dipeptidyl aminopeptidase/acylaminoacyl peptidase
MAQPALSGFGTWRSPVTSDMVASGAVRFDSQIAVSGHDTYWVESRPLEGGRSLVVRSRPGSPPADITPSPFNTRTRVHEYGGGAFAVDGDKVYFSNFADQRIYRLAPPGDPEPITPETSLRFADGVVDSTRHRMVCVCEDHTAGNRYPVNSLVAIDLNGHGGITQLVSGNDFYSSPRLSPDGSSLAWLTWNQPNMPWDYTELWLGTLSASGHIAAARRIAGGQGDSICQPRFAADGTLHFVSERTGWWNLYRWRNGSAMPLWDTAAEFGGADWSFGASSYAFASPRQIVCSRVRSGRATLASLDTETGRAVDYDLPYTSISAVQATPGHAILVAGSPTEPPSVVRLDLGNGQIEVLRRSNNVSIDPDYLSAPKDIEFPTENGVTAHAIYYPPGSRDFVAPAGERPPLLIMSHGGPTGAASRSLNLSVQYWTSRGFAVADVNYGGSTGYGRAYRQRLAGQWGIVDVDDCVNCARYLIKGGQADAKRVAIRGGSAGGYTTLAALTFRDLFRAGASYYGVSDLEALETDTHKFEARYLDTLIGPYPARRDLYLERSPIHHVDRLSCPVIFLQGSEDRVVPPSQAELMVEALRRKGLPVAYILFEGEQHGFRQGPHIKRALEAEFYFYATIFGFTPAEHIEPVRIENLR